MHTPRLITHLFVGLFLFSTTTCLAAGMQRLPIAENPNSKQPPKLPHITDDEWTLLEKAIDDRWTMRKTAQDLNDAMDANDFSNIFNNVPAIKREIKYLTKSRPIFEDKNKIIKLLVRSSLLFYNYFLEKREGLTQTTEQEDFLSRIRCIVGKIYNFLIAHYQKTGEKMTAPVGLIEYLIKGEKKYIAYKKIDETYWLLPLIFLEPETYTPYVEIPVSYYPTGEGHSFLCSQNDNGAFTIEQAPFLCIQKTSGNKSGNTYSAHYFLGQTSGQTSAQPYTVKKILFNDTTRFTMTVGSGTMNIKDLTEHEKENGLKVFKALLREQKEMHIPLTLSQKENTEATYLYLKDAQKKANRRKEYVESKKKEREELKQKGKAEPGNMALTLEKEIQDLDHILNQPEPPQDPLLTHFIEESVSLSESKTSADFTENFPDTSGAQSSNQTPNNALDKAVDFYEERLRKIYKEEYKKEYAANQNKAMNATAIAPEMTPAKASAKPSQKAHEKKNKKAKSRLPANKEDSNTLRHIEDDLAERYADDRLRELLSPLEKRNVKQNTLLKVLNNVAKQFPQLTIKTRQKGSHVGWEIGDENGKHQTVTLAHHGNEVHPKGVSDILKAIFDMTQGSISSPP